jgi:Putative abortive phage resistance protein AbiGi, antitoxin
MGLLSSNTLFHFTDKNSLLNIIKQKQFMPKYSLEEFEYEYNKKFKIGIPMVCFCDIPLSKIHEHISDYGNYGIGMSELWIKRYRLNPLLYLRAGSELFSLINISIQRLHNKENKTTEDMDQIFDLYKILRFTKQFEGENKKGKTKKLYDEKEWRFVPDKLVFGSEYVIIPEEEYKDNVITQENNSLKDSPMLFDFENINYIIIKEENEREEIINLIDLLDKDKKFKNIIISKIISTELIKNDF